MYATRETGIQFSNSLLRRSRPLSITLTEVATCILQSSTRIVIRLETVRRLQEVTYAGLAEREYEYARGSRGLIGPKKRQNAKSNRIAGG